MLSGVEDLQCTQTHTHVRTHPPQDMVFITSAVWLWQLPEQIGARVSLAHVKAYVSN